MADDDELHPGSSSSSSSASSSEQPFLTIEEQPTNENQSQEPSNPFLNPRSGVTANGSADFAQIESRSSNDTSPATAKTSDNNKKSTLLKTPSSPHSDPPIVTSIEIFDLPGANKYLGLDHSSSSSPSNKAGVLPISQMTRTTANQTETKVQTKPFRSSSSSLALPASKFYRRKLSTTTVAKTENNSKTVK